MIGILIKKIFDQERFRLARPGHSRTLGDQRSTDASAAVSYQTNVFQLCYLIYFYNKHIFLTVMFLFIQIMNRRRGVAATKNRQERAQKIAQRGEQLQKDDVAHLEDQES